MRLVIPAAAVAAALIGAAPASADGTLTASERQFADQTEAATCRYLDQVGVTQDSMTELVTDVYAYGPVTNGGDAADIINYTVYTYCPSHWSALVAFGEGFRSSSV